MNKEKSLNERFLRIYFIDNIDDGLIVDVNSDIWEEILSQKDKIIRIEAIEWIWDLQTGEVIMFH
jgi:hypothetical protein